MKKKKICIVFGTRPEAIKLAPVLLELKKDDDYKVFTCTTGQHRKMLDQVFDVFDINPDVDLNLMEANQSLAELTARAVNALDRVIATENPAVVITQGDSTSAFVASLAAFYNQVPIAHVEAGLRSYNLRAPWPEEANRVMVSHIADFQFTPTDNSRQNLLREGINPEKIHVTGNTVIDALFLVLEKVRENPPLVSGLDEAFFIKLHDKNKKLVLITGHRRENFGQGFENICRALKRLAARDDIELVYPVHLNPNVRQPVMSLLNGLPNVSLIEPASYRAFIRLMDKACIVITDSGGIQEEAPSLGKPVLVMREFTERPEAVEAGTVRLVGTDEDQIVFWAERLLDDKSEYEKMAFAHNPYGDGRAAIRISDILKNRLS